jgi:serine phosphatase RsbU (regulator of sigma subunit)/anti-sigma regulatory factor (Ser/Thr protein kinase)
MTTAGEPHLKSEIASTIQVSFDCHLDAVRPAVLLVRDFLLSRGLPEDDAAGLELALTEGANNAVEHTDPAMRDRELRIEVTMGAQDVQLRIYDQSPGFDWPEQAELPDDESESGRGLFLIQSLVDQSTYLRGPHGNCLVLMKAHQAAVTPEPSGAADEQLRELENTLAGMTDELCCSYEALTSIFRYSAELASTQNVADFAERLVRDLAVATEADLVVLRLFDFAKKELDVFRISPPNIFPPPASLPMPSAMDSVEVWAATVSNDVWFDLEHPLPGGDPLHALGHPKLGVCHPFSLNDHLYGTITVARNSDAAPFRASQVNILHTLADFLAIQIANERFLHERTRTKVVRRELDIAASIQRSLLPTRIPNASPFGIAVCCESAQDVGGDFFDILEVGDHGTLFLIADVMGKGIPAALLAAILRSVVHSLPQNFSNPAQLLSAVNRILYDDFSRVDMFATAAVAYLDRRERKLLAASAGHCPMLVAQVGEPEVQTIEASGPPLGVIPEVGYSAELISLRPGSRILLYTDGVTEVANPRKEMFGETRLANWFGLPRQAGRTAVALKDLLAGELARFREGHVVRDDQTFIIIADNSL